MKQRVGAVVSGEQTHVGAPTSPSSAGNIEGLPALRWRQSKTGGEVTLPMLPPLQRPSPDPPQTRSPPSAATRWFACRFWSRASAGRSRSLASETRCRNGSPTPASPADQHMEYEKRQAHCWPRRAALSTRSWWFWGTQTRRPAPFTPGPRTAGNWPVKRWKRWPGRTFCEPKCPTNLPMWGTFPISTEISTLFFGNGEPAGVRTLDLLIKSQLLYQLSYRLSPQTQRGGIP